MNFLIVTSLMILFFGPFLIMSASHTYIPKTQKLKIARKDIGAYTYYQPQFYRLFFGWTGFNASKYDGKIWISSNWTYDKNDCNQTIEIYKNLKFGTPNN